MLWFENSSLLVQASLLFIVVMLPMLLIQWIFEHSANTREWAEGSQTTLMSAIALCFGMMASFTFVEVTNLFDKASTEVIHEASALYAALDLAELLPQEVQYPIVVTIHNHLHYVIEKEWPLMRNRSANLTNRDDYLVESYKALANINTTDPGDMELGKQMMSYLETARIAETSRLIVSKAHVHPLKWVVLFLLAILVQLALAISHGQTPKCRFLAMHVFSFAVILYFLIIVAFNHAFGGEVCVSPSPMLDVLEYADNLKDRNEVPSPIYEILWNILLPTSGQDGILSITAIQSDTFDGLSCP
jgi:hypothetical protein